MLGVAVRTRNRTDVGGSGKYVYYVGRWPKGYSLSGPVDDLRGPRQYPFASATGTSSRKYSCIFNCAPITWTGTIIPGDALPRDHQYQQHWGVRLWSVAGSVAGMVVTVFRGTLEARQR